MPGRSEVEGSAMRFADPGLVVAALLAALWLVALVALGRADSGSRWVRLLSPPAYVVGGIGAVLLVSEAAVVDAVEDGTAVARWDRPVLDWIRGAPRGCSHSGDECGQCRRRNRRDDGAGGRSRSRVDHVPSPGPRGVGRCYRPRRGRARHRVQAPLRARAAAVDRTVDAGDDVRTSLGALSGFDRSPRCARRDRCAASQARCLAGRSRRHSDDGCVDHRGEQAVPGRALAHRRPDGLATRWGVARDVRHRTARLPTRTPCSPTGEGCCRGFTSSPASPTTAPR